MQTASLIGSLVPSLSRNPQLMRWTSAYRSLLDRFGKGGGGEEGGEKGSGRSIIIIIIIIILLLLL